MFRRVLLAALLAGIAAALVMAAVQYLRVTPLILEAEVYETAEAPHAHAAAAESANTAAAPAPAAAEHQHEEGGWKPADGLERTLFTLMADVLAGIGFALVVAAASLVLNIPITMRNGLLWGLCGFLVFSLAPAAGLPPELPGMPAADLHARQIWWWATVAATAGGVAIIALRRSLPFLLAALVLMALPHIIGAPSAPAEESAVPAHLATAFAANSLAAAAIFWLVLGITLAALMDRGVNRA